MENRPQPAPVDENRKTLKNQLKVIFVVVYGHRRHWPWTFYVKFYFRAFKRRSAAGKILSLQNIISLAQH